MEYSSNLLLEEAVNSYLMWELSKSDIRKLIKSKTKQEEIEELILKRLSSLKKTPLKNKLEQIKALSTDRYNLFINCRWRKENYSISDLGTVLPKCGDLPLEVITQPFPKVVEYVKDKLKKTNQEDSIKYVAELVRISRILRITPPIVIEPGYLQRNVKNLEEYYKIQWNSKEIFKGRGYIEDGNHRAIALVIAYEIDSIPCYVGRHLTTVHSK